jgi:hypothetical protein
MLTELNNAGRRWNWDGFDSWLDWYWINFNFWGFQFWKWHRFHTWLDWYWINFDFGSFWGWHW